MIKKLFAALILMISISHLVHAQDPFSDDRIQQTDDESEETSAEEDTTELIPVESNLYWYDIQNTLSLKTDSSRYEIHRLADEKKIIYMDMSDIFRSQPLWFDYDLIEAGRPAYISFINTYPHQTPLFFGGTLANDYLHGVYNTQFIPLNYIQYAEVDYSSGSLQNYGLWSGTRLHITPHSVHTQRPWTKILYKQGSYGYSDVDIHFEVPFSSTFAVQLGGKSTIFDGAIQGSGFEGENYRAEITWQYSPNLYIRSQMFLNRNEVGLASFDADQEFPLATTNEERDDYYLDITWLPDDSLGQRFRLLFYYSYYLKNFRDPLSSFAFETKSQRFGLDANYNFLVGAYELLLGASTLLPQIWGDPFNRGVNTTILNTYGKINLPFTEFLNFRAGLQLSYIENHDLQLLPGIGTDIIFSEKSRLSFDATRGQRLPNATEKFFNFDTLYGNKDLIPEKYYTFAGHYDYIQKSKWHVKLDAGYHRIENEIVWKDSTFFNQGSRDFIFSGFEGFFRVWWFDFTVAGQYTFADLNLTPASSVWGRAHFNWVLLDGALIFDAFGTLTWYDKHQAIKYQPRLDRYYAGQDETEGFVMLNWRLVATFRGAHVFLEMDNALQENYEIISGYPDFYRRMRFGINWTLWD